jgi:hypothetical protein
MTVVQQAPFGVAFGVMIGFAGGKFELLLGFFGFEEKVSDGFASVGFTAHGQQGFCRWVHMNQQEVAIH